MTTGRTDGRRPRTPRRRTGRAVRAAASLAAIAGLVGCGVPSEGVVETVPAAEVPYGLAETTTTSSSTSVAPADTSVPPGPPDGEPEIVAELATLHFVAGDRIVETIAELVSPATETQVLAALVAGPPPGDSGVGLRSAVPATLVVDLSVARGVATLDVDRAFLEALTPVDQRLAIAQLVLTLTRRPGIGQVVVAESGTPIAVPRGNGSLAPAGTPVSYDDYSRLLG
ncbi:MAG: GerMN domain-containing protein [Ilumatobacteraceae bacterium]